jgi:tetratricopeptide (TPR) repeat protein
MRAIILGLCLFGLAAPAFAQMQSSDDFERAQALDAQGRYQDAVEGFTRVIDQTRDARAYQGRGVAYEHAGRHDQAIADFTRAIALRPDFAAAYASRGVAYDQKGLYNRAIADYTQAIGLKDATAQTRFNRAAAYEHRRSYAKAVNDYRAALAIDPTLQPARDGLKRLGARDRQ